MARLRYIENARTGDAGAVVTHDNKLFFDDDNAYINASSSGTLDLVATTVAITGNLTVSGSLSYGSEAVTLNQSLMGELTVGIDDTGYDVKFYGAGSGYYWLWDEDGDANGGVVLVGTFTETGNAAITGTFDVTGNTTVTGTYGVTGNTTLTGTLTVGENDTGYDVIFYTATSGSSIQVDESEDALNITAVNTTMTGTLTVGVNDTGHDVKFFGATDGSYWSWDESEDGVVQVGSLTVTGAVSVTGNIGVVGTLTVGINDTGHDVKFYGATSGSYLLWDESENRLELDGADINLQDSDILQFGDGQDVAMSFDGTDFDITAAADESIIKFGNGTNDFDIWIYSGSNTVVFNEGDSKVVFDGYDIQLNDADILKFGDLAAGDITMAYSGSAFAIAAAAASDTMTIGATSHVINTTLTGTFTVGVNDTGHDVKFFGASDGAYMLWDESADDLILAGAAGLVIGAAATGITFNGANTTACISMDGATLANGDHEIEMRNNVAGDKTIIASGGATDDAGIVTAVGADGDIADGSIYMSCTDGGGDLFVKINDTWTSVVNT